MGKMVKIVLRLFAALFAILLIAVLTHPLWVGSVASCVAESTMTEMTKSDFSIDDLDVNLFTGKVRVRGLALKSPEDAKKDSAVKIWSIDVSFEPMSMASDVRHINEITIEDFHIYGDVKFSNLRAIVDNIEEYLAAHPKDPDEKESKLIIDRIVIKGLKFTYGVMPISIPFDIVITDIGKESEGASEEDVVDIIVDKVCQAAEKTNKMLGKALRLAIEGGSIVAEGVEAVKDVGGKTVDGIKGLFK